MLDDELPALILYESPRRRSRRGWARRLALTIDNAFISSDLTDFPVLVTGDLLPAEIWSGASSAQFDGGDLVATRDAAGNMRLAMEVVSFDPLTRRAEIWVCLPSVSSAADTTFYLWYGTRGGHSQPAASAAYGRNAVWDSSHKGVWHANDSTWTDSTSNGLTGTEQYGTARYAPTKLGGNAAKFGGSVINVGSGAATQLGASLTLEAWVSLNPTNTPAGSNTQGIIGKDKGSNNTFGYELQFLSGKPRLIVSGAASQDVLAGPAVIANNSFRHVVATSDGTTLRMYVDGAEVATASQTQTPSYATNFDLMIGALHGASNVSTNSYAWALIDEIRISNTRRSAAWIAASYANGNAPATFMAAGSPTASRAAAEFYATQAALPSNHGAGSVVVSIVGTGVSWSAGTTFTVSGVSGWAVSSKAVTDSTHAALTLSCPAAATPATGATGTLTISDGLSSTEVPVVVPRIAASPANGPASTARTLTLVGYGTVWSGETAAGLLTVSSGSVGTPTVTADGALTVSYTPGTSDATLTDSSTGATCPLRAMAALPTLTTASAAYKAVYTADRAGAVDGAGVTTWADVSGNALDLTATLLTAPRAWAKGSDGEKPCLEFDRILGSKLQAAAAADWTFLHNGDAFHLFAVYRDEVTDQDYVGINDEPRFLLGTGGMSSTSRGLAIYASTWSTEAGQAGAYFSRGNGVALSLAGSTGTVLPRVVQCLELSCDGANNIVLRNWGTSIGTGSLSSPNAGAPAAPLTVGVHPTLGLGLTGRVMAVVIVNGASLNAADAAAIRAWAEASYHPAGTAAEEILLDTQAVASLSGASRALLTPAKDGGNPIFEAAASGVDENKVFLSARKHGAGDYRMTYGCWEAATGREGIAYATSADGTTWTKPNLGQVSANGDTDNNLLHAWDEYGGGADYDTGDAYPYVRAMELWGATYSETPASPYPSSSPAGLRVLRSTDGLTWSAARNVFLGTYADTNGITHKQGSPSYREGKSVYRRPDGRYVGYCSSGHLSERRSIIAMLSDTDDPTGTWSDLGPLAEFTSSAQTRQYYGINVTKRGRVWFGWVLIFNKTTEGMDLELWCSRDGGLKWYPANGGTGNFFDRGADTTWDDGMLLSADLIAESGAWNVYYSGADALHNDAAYTAQVGIAALSPGRVVSYGTTGVVTGRYTYAPGKTLTVNANAAGGTLTVALLDAEGNVITGYDDTDSTSVSADTSGTAVTWGANTTLPSQPVRPRFTLTDATLYSWTVG